METCAGSMEGYSRTPKNVKPMKPNNIIKRFSTMVKTGLLMLVVDKLIMIFDLRFLSPDFFLLL